MPPCSTIERINNQISKLLTSRSENQAVWKSNNQGFKEDTFIQMGSRDRVTEKGREAEWSRKAQVAVGRTMDERDILEASDPSPTRRVPVPGK